MLRSLLVLLLLFSLACAAPKVQEPDRPPAARPEARPSAAMPQPARPPAARPAARPSAAMPQAARPSAAMPQPQAPQPATPAAGFETIVQPFLAENCYPCHGNKKQKRDLNFEAIESVASLTEDPDRWDEVVLKLRHREMPPEDEDQPPETQRQAVATWIATERERIDRITPPDPGRVTTRRLNRTEYNNTIRDLLGVTARPADDFPQDDSGYGFDNIGDVLSLSPALMERYVSAAERVSREAVFGPPTRKPTLIRLRSDGRRPRDARTFPGEYDVTGLSVPNAFHAIYKVPVDGEYVVRVGLGGLRPRGSEAISLALWVDQQQVQTVVFDGERAATFNDDRQDFGSQATELRVKLQAGERWISVAIPRIFEGLPARYVGPNPSTRPTPPPKEFKPRPGASDQQIAAQRKTFDDAQADLEKIPMNGVRVGTVDIGGPYSQATGPARESLQKIYTCGHLNGGHTAMCATRIMTDLARRAFRRAVTSGEVEKFVSLVRMAEKEEGSFPEGLSVGIQALLVSPDFLFRIEQDRPGVKAAPVTFTPVAAHVPAAIPLQPITQHQLATRLSYFLWSTMPDAELRRAADAGGLRNPQVLAAQVRRMLRDPKARALAENFGGQWLEFRALESITRDRDRYPDFEDYLRFSMRRETELFVDHIVREDRSILDFIDGRYSFLNERLARHYGIPNVSGPEFRPVDLTATPRGGVLTQGSVLTVSSYATRTSPVLRGKWVLDNLLNTPPPPPPADVPNLDEASIGTSASLREQLEMHRKDPICASCHRRMDPLGFGLENFDAVGAWRNVDGKFAIDSSGILPDGEEFKGPDELRNILKQDSEAFSRALTSKLLTYALGRGLERYDTKTVRLIAGRLPAREYKFSALVLEIVNSLPFRQKRAMSMAPPTGASTQ